MSKFHIRLKTTLKERKIKQSDFAKKIGVFKRYLGSCCCEEHLKFLKYNAL